MGDFTNSTSSVGFTSASAVTVTGTRSSNDWCWVCKWGTEGNHEVRGDDEILFSENLRFYCVVLGLLRILCLDVVGSVGRFSFLPCGRLRGGLGLRCGSAVVCRIRGWRRV